MPWSALPEHLNSPEKWGGTDDDKWWMKWRLQIKGWFAYGPRADQWWAKWRAYPVTLFTIGGKGPWRWESAPLNPGFIYFSRIQYWTRWHFQVQWPFMIAFHFYFNEKDVMVPTISPNGASVTNKLIYFYVGASYDQDAVYWFPAIFIGGTWK